MAGTFKISLRAVSLLAIALALLTRSAMAETILVMAEEDGCHWCAKWDQEIGGEYPGTAEGRAAPLVRVGIHDNLPDAMTFADRLVYTPTFVLIQDGREIGRIEGYPGEDFFWPLLQRMLDEAGIDWQEGQE